MKKILLIGVIAFIGLFMLSCMGRYTAPKLVKGGKPTPKEDYLKLKTFFENKGGRLEAADDTIVKWKDTKIYRIYEFKHHTVAIFPFNWNEKQFDMYIFAGHLKKYDDLLNDISLKFRYSDLYKTGYHINDSITLDKNLFPYKVGIKYFFLGSSINNVLEQSQRLYKIGSCRFISGFTRLMPIDFHKEKGKTYKIPVAAQISFNNYQANLEFIDNKLVWMEFITPRMPMIAHYGLANNEKLGVVAQGEFKLPVRITKTKPEDI